MTSATLGPKRVLIMRTASPGVKIQFKAQQEAQLWEGKLLRIPKLVILSSAKHGKNACHLFLGDFFQVYNGLVDGYR